MGKLVFPKEYPWKAPGIMFLTDNGRFVLNTRICLSISDFHPESWSPALRVRSIITSLISFFVSNESTSIGMCGYKTME